MPRNLGSTTLRRRRRRADPMANYDALPTPLRLWLATAALPWSPQSCKRIWEKSRKQGLSVEETIAHLSALEHKSLARDRVSNARP
ncbi:DUF6525 family protein [Nereida sp. MMG025]|uniref:DUF6525 family protein n=1 Tax=Nereida sp. MMG025 TaxID=2909981 RepID=UPI001F24DE90|nr:DUF6525 family protein [Nereida sp. MMG025]MCF6444732.1 DUF6525 family protein [Nereida sp. MMG025]